MNWIQQQGWFIGDWQIPQADGSVLSLTINRDGTWSVVGKPDGHVWLRPKTGSIDLRTDDG